MLNARHHQALEEAQSKGWRAVLWYLLAQFGRLKVDPRRGETAAEETLDRRTQVLFALFEELREAGYKVFPNNLSRKHVELLLEKWIVDGDKPSTLQSKLSILRTFCRWIGKQGLVPPNDILFEGRLHLIRRKYATDHDRSPEAAGVASEDLFARADDLDKSFGRIIRVERILGLRRKEAVCFQPHVSDRGTHLLVFKGTKGGRERHVSINTVEKRELVDKLKAEVREGMALGEHDGAPDGLKKSLNRVNYLARKLKMTRKQLGITQHDLRAAHLTDELEREGILAPVRGGMKPETQEEKDAFRTAGLRVMQEAGHSRTNVGSAYYGSYRPEARSRETGEGE